MSDVERTDGNDNIGGIKSIEFIEQYYLLAFTVPLNGQVSADDIAFMDDHEWQSFDASPESIKPDISNKDTEHGLLWDIQYTLKFPKQSAVIGSQLAYMEKRPYLLRITDQNNVVTIIGNASEFINMRFIPLNDSSPGSYNGYEVIFYGEFSQAPVYEI